MKIYKDEAIKNFEFWSGAKDTIAELTDEQCDMLEAVLEDLYPDGVEDMHLNDIFWFERDFIAECLGFESWEELVTHNAEEED